MYVYKDWIYYIVIKIMFEVFIYLFILLYLFELKYIYEKIKIVIYMYFSIIV